MYPRPAFERLENRQLLSAAGCDASVELLDAIGESRAATFAAAAPAASAALGAAPAAAASTNPFAAELLGTFRGEAKVKKYFLSKELDVELVVTEVTDAGITGKLTVEGSDAEGTFPGRLTPKGRFSYTFREDGKRVSLKGKIVPENDRLVGKIKAKGFGVSASGSFKLDRVPEPAPTPQS